jgi:hypothetical protein
MSDRDRLAAAFGFHKIDRVEGGEYLCRCGWREYGIKGEWDIHVADALLAAGVTMPAPARELCKWAFIPGTTRGRCILTQGHDGEHANIEEVR